MASEQISELSISLMLQHQCAKMHFMRTTLDLPDALLRQLKAKAALEGTSLKALMRSIVERGLRAPAEPASQASASPSTLPSIRLGRPLNLAHPSNAALFELLVD